MNVNILRKTFKVGEHILKFNIHQFYKLEISVVNSYNQVFLFKIILCLYHCNTFSLEKLYIMNTKSQIKKYAFKWTVIIRKKNCGTIFIIISLN